MSIKFKKDDVIQNTVYDVYENYDESKSTVEDIILPERDKDKDPILDIADHSARFNELLKEKVDEIFSSTKPFCPTDDLKICRSCPYAQLCRH